MDDAAVILDGVSRRAGGVQILHDVTLGFAAGRFNVILGPNGAGKSTLIRIAAGHIARLEHGTVSYWDAPLDTFEADALARRRAVLSQQIEMAFPLAVEDVVMMGRYPHYRGVPSARDREIVREALALVEMTERRHQLYPTLSGGERQKTQLARVLAQVWQEEGTLEQTVLFLDEPTASLDLHFQLQLLATARTFLRRGATIVASLHDLNLAFDFGDRFFVMEGGRLVHQADAPEDMPKELIERVWRVKADPIAAGGRTRWYFRV
ncbi:MAG TPA: ATP-binding cassette domain-containing protein [Rhizomicrobium sp.]|nr:ATP-binding cassette domain-containing protein [Rhizomicrobium sp.]